MLSKFSEMVMRVNKRDELEGEYMILIRVKGEGYI